jgi:hypothetical protein
MKGEMGMTRWTFNCMQHKWELHATQWTHHNTAICSGKGRPPAPEQAWIIGAALPEAAPQMRYACCSTAAPALLERERNMRFHGAV